MDGHVRRTTTLLATALVIASAGCVDAAPTTALGASSSAPQATVHQSAGQGTLDGVVLDDEARPIEGAKVAGQHRDVMNQTFEVASGPGGRFLVTGLQEGTYIVQVTRFGYYPSPPRLVEVKDGETASLILTLEPTPSYEPFHATKTHNIHWNWDAGVILPVVGYQGATGTSWEGSNVTEPYPIDEKASGELTGIIVEAVWTPSLAYFSGAFRTDLYSPEQTGLDATFPPLNGRHWADTNPFHWDNVPERARSPTYLFVPRNGDNVSAMHSTQRTALNGGSPIETSGRWLLEVQSAGEYAKGAFGTPVDVAGTWDQNVRIHVTFFFMGDPEPGWTFLPKG
ncbi:MAG: carboxypeptidase regulatory-like domain-containing protein [Euryarchaeota archaeon]|nr:carboxypeptidase regulatory-like domain-containing protein [Euryarchaeota archaeon]